MTVLTNRQLQSLTLCDLHLCAAVSESNFPENVFDVGVLVKDGDPKSGQYVFVKRGCYVWLNLFRNPFSGGGMFDLSGDLGKGYAVYSERKYYEKWPEAAA
jgi:hypothetical protein